MTKVNIIRTREARPCEPRSGLPPLIDYIFEFESADVLSPSLLMPVRVTLDEARQVLGDGLPDFPLAAWSALHDRLGTAMALTEARLAATWRSSRAGWAQAPARVVAAGSPA